MQIQHDWRNFVRENLSGHGLEIGALHAPFPVNAQTTIEYADEKSQTDLQTQYANDAGVDCSKIPAITYITHAGNLPIKNNTYDFVCNSHLLEHLVNPFSAISEWLRVVKPGGYVFMVVPDKNYCFDKNRQLTDLDHLKEDWYRVTSLIAISHYADYFINGRGVTDTDTIAKAYKAQANIHVHTWDKDTLKQHIHWLANFLSFTVVDYKAYALNLCVLIRKNQQ